MNFNKFYSVCYQYLLKFLDYTQLLEYEPKAAEQVPLLMKMKRDQLALEKAIESGDTDLGESDHYVACNFVRFVFNGQPTCIHEHVYCFYCPT